MCVKLQSAFLFFPIVLKEFGAMATFRSWAFLLFVVLAVAQCTESRSTERRRRDNSADYDFGNTAATAAEEGLQGDAGENDGVQGDDGDDDDDDEIITPAILRSAPEDYRAKPGQTVWFPCNIENNSSAVVVWEHGEKRLYQASGTYIGKLDKDTKIIVHSNWSIEIPNVGPEDVGKYMCKLLGSPALPQQQVTHTLRLLSGPETPRIIGMWPQNEGRRVVEGSELRITCHTDGHPKPTLSWSKAVGQTNKRVTREEVAFERDSILIRNVQRHHAGKYICMAENGVGNPAIDSVTIQVVGKPRVHVHKSLVNAAVGVTAVLACTAHDEPESVITWTKDNVELVDSADVIIEQKYPTSTIRIPVVKEKDFGTYTCIARNLYGEHSRSAILVEEPVLEELTVQGGNLIWRIQSHMPLSEVQLQYRRTDEEAADWQKILVKPERTQEHHVHSVTYSLRDLPSGKYEAVSRARNDHGWSSPTHSVFFEGAVEEPKPESIQTAGVGGLGGGAAELKSTLTLLTTLFTCLLIRLI